MHASQGLLRGHVMSTWKQLLGIRDRLEFLKTLQTVFVDYPKVKQLAFAEYLLYTL